MIDLEDLRGKHTGRPALILGSGPSLRLVPDDVGERYVLFAVNGAISRFREPDYFCTRDRLVLPECEYWPAIRAAGCVYALFEANEDTPVHSLDVERSVVLERKGDLLMSSDSTKVICGYSSQCAVHFALMLGCSPIYLVGCDCRYVGGKRYFTQFGDGDGARKTGEEVERDFSRMMTLDGLSDTGLGLMFSTWLRIADVNPHLNVIDASEGRLWRVFEHIAPQEL
jgi:hypothetical protein